MNTFKILFNHWDRDIEVLQRTVTSAGRWEIEHLPPASCLSYCRADREQCQMAPSTHSEHHSSLLSWTGSP